jgi:hypothetical protein
MEPKFQSSFIPKGPLATTGTVTKTSRVSGRSILGTLAILIFTLAILASLGVFGYEWYLKADIRKMGDSLVGARTSLEPEVIEKISSLDERIVSTKRLLNSHIVLSPLFEFLENSTVRAVRFTSFDYNSIDGRLSLSIKGEARGYSALALQSEILNASPYLKDIVFADLSLNNQGMVNFAFKASVDPSIISFNKGAEPIAPTASTTTPVESVTQTP